MQLLPARSEDGAASFFPFLTWARTVNRQTLGADLMAGLTGAVIMIPQGVAFATLAGMPPEYGLYAGMIPAIVAALFGSSWHLVSGPTTAASIIIFSSVGGFAEPGTPAFVQLVLTLTFMVGLIELTMGLLRLGALANFISHTVAIGFTAGAAILIAAHQVENFFGIEVPAGAAFYEVARILARDAGEISWATTAIGVLTIVSGFMIKKWFPRFPHMIGAMLVGSAFAALLGGLAGITVPAINAIPSDILRLSGPALSMDVIRDLAPTALAVAIFALTEAVSISRSLAVRSGQQLDGSQEFIGQGLSNLVGCFFSGYVATGSFNRSAANFAAGARTPLAAACAGLILIALVPLVAPFAGYLPKAVVAGILCLVVVGLIDVPHIRQIIQSSKSETTVMAVTFFSVLFINLEVAIFAGVILSLLFYLNRTSHPKVTTLAPNAAAPRRRFSTDASMPECPQVKIARIDGSLFYGAVSNVMAQLRRLERHNPSQKSLLVVASGINFVDIEGAEALVGEARRRRAAGGRLYLVGIKEAVAYQMERVGYLEVIGRENVFSSKTEALGAVYRNLDPEVCVTCTKRIFRECNESQPSARTETKSAPPPPQAEPAPKPKPAPPPRQRSTGDTRPPRILALVDFEADARATASEAWRIAQETDGELALGQVVNWRWGSGNVLQIGLVASAAESAVCVPARKQLGEIAEEIGIEETALLASAAADRARAVLELIEDWNPDVIVVHARSWYDFARRPYLNFDTPHGRIRCRIHAVS